MEESDAFYTPRDGREVVLLGVTSVLEAHDDPEDTLMVQLSKSDLALICFLLYFPGRLFPELYEQITRLNHRLVELTMAQEFLPWGPGEAESILEDDEEDA